MIAAIAIGLAAGVLGGVLGVGGGVLFVPGLVLFLSLSQHQAEGTSLLAIVPVGLVGSVEAQPLRQRPPGRRAADRRAFDRRVRRRCGARERSFGRGAQSGLRGFDPVDRRPACTPRTRPGRKMIPGRRYVVDWSDGTGQSTAHRFPGRDPAARVRRQTATGDRSLARQRYARVQGLGHRRGETAYDRSVVRTAAGGSRSGRGRTAGSSTGRSPAGRASAVGAPEAKLASRDFPLKKGNKSR